MPSLLNPYVLLGLVLGVVGSFGFGVYTGYGWADSKAEVAAYKSAIDSYNAVVSEYERQAQALKDVTEQAERRSALAEQAARENSDEVDRYAAELAARPAPACQLGDADVARLRDIISRTHRGAPFPSPVPR